MPNIEVQASINPVSYFSPLPKSIQKSTGRSAMSTKERSVDELKLGIQEWIDKKYHLKSKVQLRNKLYPGDWTHELVVHKIKHPEELQMLIDAGIRVHYLKDIVMELETKKMIIASASGASLVDLVLLDIED